MHHKVLFALAGAFLAVAMVVPIVAFKLQADSDADDISDLIPIDSIFRF